MRYSEKNIDMLTGSLYRSILFFTIPIALSSMLQQLFNASDTAIVGLFDTSSSLAAVGTNGEIIALIVALSSGLSVGVNVLVAQQIGQLYRCRKILRICLVFSIVSSLILIEPLVIFRNFFAGFFSADQTVIQNACLRILCILFFEPLCNLYEIPAGVLRGTGHSLYPAVATIIGNCCFRIVWICTVFRHYHQLNILYYAFPISWVLTIILITIGFIAKKPDKTF